MPKLAETSGQVPFAVHVLDQIDLAGTDDSCLAIARCHLVRGIQKLDADSQFALQ